MGAPGQHNRTDRHSSRLGLPGCVSHKRLVAKGVEAGGGAPIKLKLNKRVRGEEGRRGYSCLSACLCVSGVADGVLLPMKMPSVLSGGGW